jgi:hypothetical protein
MRTAVLVCAAVAMVACGNTPDPVGLVPGADVSGVVPILDGRTGQPVPNVPVIADRPGDIVSIVVPGFLSLRTTLRGGPVTLWPADGSLPQTTRALVYWNQDPNRMFRHAPGTTTIGIQPIGVLAGGQYLQEVTRAAALLTQAHGTLHYVVGPGQFTVTVSVDPDSPIFNDNPGASAAAPMSYDDRTRVIIQASVVMRSADVDGFWYGWDNFRVAVAHELGHTTGLLHLDSAVEEGIMSPNGHSYDYRDFTATEKLMMHLHYSRRPGTQLAGMQEDETLAVVQSTGRSISMTVVD